MRNLIHSARTTARLGDPRGARRRRRSWSAEVEEGWVSWSSCGLPVRRGESGWWSTSASVLDGVLGQLHEGRLERVLPRRRARGARCRPSAARRPMAARRPVPVTPSGVGSGGSLRPRRRRRRAGGAAARPGCAPGPCRAGHGPSSAVDVGDEPAAADDRRSARRSAPSRSSGATTRTRCGPRRRGPCSRLRIHRMPSGSRPLTGSSSMTVSGSPSRAEAMPSRWPMPSEKPPAARRRRRSRPTRSSTSSTRDAGMPVVAASARRWLRASAWGGRPWPRAARRSR